MTLTQNNLFTESYNQLKDFLNTNISDPRGRFKKQWIHASLPDITNKGFDGYPFIVINVNVAEAIPSLDRATSEKVFRATLLIYAEDGTTLDTLCNEIYQKFKSKTLTNSLSDFKAIQISSSPFDYQVIGGKKIMRRTIGIIGRKRI